MENCVFSSSFNTPNVVSGFCHFGLVFFMVLWQSPDTPDMSCFHVSVLEPCALSSACLVLCSDPGTRVLSFGFVSGFRHSRSMFCLVVWVCGLECARPCALLSMQFVFYRCDCYQFTLDVTLCRVLSCCVSVRSQVCSNRALSHLGVLFRVGAWCSDPGTHVLSFGFVSGFRHSRSVFCLVVWVCGLESCALSSACFVSCWSVVFGSRHSCLEFRFRVGVQTLAPCSVLLCECAVSSVLESCALSSGCFVSCWSVVFGSRHSCLEFRFRVGVQTLALCSVLLCECAVSSVLGRVLFCLCSLCFIGVIVISSPSLLPCVVSCLALPSRVASLVSPTVCFVYLY